MMPSVIQVFNRTEGMLLSVDIEEYFKRFYQLLRNILRERFVYKEEIL